LTSRYISTLEALFHELDVILLSLVELGATVDSATHGLFPLIESATNSLKTLHVLIGCLSGFRANVHPEFTLCIYAANPLSFRECHTASASTAMTGLSGSLRSLAVALARRADVTNLSRITSASNRSTQSIALWAKLAELYTLLSRNGLESGGPATCGERSGPERNIDLSSEKLLVHSLP
jgi:hypothetical protein